MLRKLALSMAVAGAIASSQANALGLGDIRIKSALNEPLNAEIQLSQIRDLNPLQIRPRMAGQDEFALAGISQQRALNGVRFQVKVNPNGTGVIELTSREPVKEPFLNFLVEVNWPSGRLVREYTVLLDPPVFDPSPTQRPVIPAAVPSRQPVVPAVQPQPKRQSPVQPAARSQPQPAAARASNIQTRANPKTETYVDSKDTLWGLAIEHRAAPDISSYQMMVALFKKNPEAFPDNNINNLKAGLVLQLPTEAEARAITSKEAAAEVRRQTAAWKNRGKPSAPAPIDGSKPSLKSEAADSKDVEAAPEGQLKVITPTDASKDDAAQNSQNPSAETDAEKKAQELEAKNEELEEKLAVSLESIDRLERDNSDLNNKLDVIQQQLDSLQRLLELKNDGFAELEALLREKEAAETAQANASSESILDKILGTPAYLAGLGGGAIAILAGLWLLLRRKRQSADDEVDEALIAPVDLEPQEEISDDELAAALEESADETAETPEAEEESESIDLDDINSLDELESLDDLDDLEDLDLDMDLNLDESFENDLDALSEDSLEDESLETALEDDEANLDELDAILGEDVSEEVDDDEFDLGLDDDLEELDLSLPDEPTDTAVDAAVAPAEPELDPLDESLDAMLAEDLDDEGLDIADDTALDELISLDLDDEVEQEASRQRNERSGMGMVDSIDDDEDSAEETLESLGLTQLADTPFESTESEEASQDLDFDLDDLSGNNLEDEMSKLEAELEGLDFALDDESEGVSGDKPAQASTDSASDNASDDETTLADLDALLDEDSVESEVVAEAEEATIDEEDLMADLDSMLDGEDDLENLSADSNDHSEAVEVPNETLESLSDDLDDLDLDSLLSEEELSLDDADADLGLVDAEQESSEASLDELLDLEIDDAAEIEADVDLAGLELDDELPKTPSDTEITQELTSNIEHDLDAELDDELDALLNSTDNDIALEETSSAEEEIDEDPFDALGLLDGADEVETKLDLARAYIDMGDVEGAKDILDEIAEEGNEAQVSEARGLLEGLA